MPAARRTLVPVLTGALALGLSVVPVQPASAAPVRGGDQVVVAESSGSGPRRVVRTAVEVVRGTGTTTVDNQNVARAVSSDCTGCRAVAVAFQAVLVPPSATRVVPENGAAAFNVRCKECTTVASAYQYVVTTRATSLDDDVEDDVAALARRVRRTAESGRSAAEIVAALDRLELEFRAIVDRGLADEAVEDDDDEQDVEDGDDAGDEDDDDDDDDDD